MTAYGFVEVTGVTAAITLLDEMVKGANVTPVTWEKKWGGRLVSVLVKGDTAAVQAAIDIANASGFKKPVLSGVLSNPHEEVVRLIGKSKGLGALPPLN